MSLTYLGSATGRRIGELEIALRIVQQAETLCLELGNKDGLQRSYGNQAAILRAWGRLEEAMALHKKQENSAWSWATKTVSSGASVMHFRTLLSAVGGCCARSLAWSANVKNSAESDTLPAFFWTVRV